MTEMYPLINQIHATLPAPARRTLHAWEATLGWSWHWQGRAVACSWAGGMGQGKGPSIHPCLSVTALAFLGCEPVSEQIPLVCPVQAAEDPC